MVNENYIGKYVCFDRMDGGACWGRIKDEAVVNTMNGEKEVFILDERYVRTPCCNNRQNFRYYFPNASDTSQYCPAQQTPSGLQQGDIEYIVKKVWGDTTIRKEMIDLENDIVDVDEILKHTDEDTLFKMILDNPDTREVDGKTAMEIGMQALDITEKAKAELTQRLKHD